jgi:YfiH family protein
VRAVCTTRAGGVSQGRFESLNLGDHVHDDAVAVAENRSRLQADIGVRPVFLQQVHGVDVLRLDAACADGSTADGCVTTEAGLACTVMVADCLPVLFTDSEGRQVAAAHAGWRGLANGVLEATLQALRETAGEGEVIAWLGPCIGPSAFEVGAEVREAFVSLDADAAAHFRFHGQDGKYWANLPALARRRLQGAGVAQLHGNDGSDAWCTVTQASRFFSHRRDAARLGSTGRMAACIWID